MTASYPDADKKTHCGFRFEGGMKCLAASVHPIHNAAWPSREVDHKFVAEPHRWTEPRCYECGQPA